MIVTYREYWTEVDRIAAELSSTPEELEESYGTDDAYEILNQMIEARHLQPRALRIVIAMRPNTAGRLCEHTRTSSSA